ncbi:hypothetical protein KIW84_052375 [Lathyrus oleraceus]|uniref:Uncharacterized protein n=1 Tax=Pisum sativum TaxID=3888 RepID=A0A9D5AF28_PEA|nr:hypothetical protein KIW84_052375 [Pisum sativum]
MSASFSDSEVTEDNQFEESLKESEDASSNETVKQEEDQISEPSPLRQRSSVLEVRGLESRSRVNNIIGNTALIQDVLRVAAGATGANIRGDRIFSDIMRISERINLRL